MQKHMIPQRQSAEQEHRQQMKEMLVVFQSCWVFANFFAAAALVRFGCFVGWFGWLAAQFMNSKVVVVVKHTKTKQNEMK